MPLLVLAAGQGSTPTGAVDTTASATISTAWTTAVAALPTQPVVWYRMDSSTSTETNQGSSGSADNGTVGGNMIEGATGLLVGNPDKAMLGPGTLPTTAGAPDSVHCAQDATHLQPTGALSLVVIIRPSGINASTGNALIFYGDQNATLAYGFWINPSGDPHFRLTGSSSNEDLSTATVLALGVNYLLVATFDGSTMKVYVNGGQEAATTSYSGSINYGTLSGTIGLGVGYYSQTATGSSISAFQGTIDEPMVFNVALTAAQVATLWDGMQNAFQIQRIATGSVKATATGTQSNASGSVKATATAVNSTGSASLQPATTISTTGSASIQATSGIPRNGTGSVSVTGLLSRNASASVLATATTQTFTASAVLAANTGAITRSATALIRVTAPIASFASASIQVAATKSSAASANIGTVNTIVRTASATVVTVRAGNHRWFESLATAWIHTPGWLARQATAVIWLKRH